MSYFGEVSMRPGRTQVPIKSKTPAANVLSTAAARGGYRATGGFSVPDEPTPESTPSTPATGSQALSQFAVPKSPGALTQIGVGVGTKVAADALGKTAGPALKNAAGYAKNAIEAPLTANFNDTSMAAPTAAAGGGLDWGNGATSYPLRDAGQVTGTSLPPADSGFTTGAEVYDAPQAVDAASSVADFGDAAFEGANAADLAMELGDTAGAAGDAAGGGIPYLGAGLRLAQGDVKGAGLSAAGTALGSAFGPVGAAVGGFLGGAISNNCFITEAVMAAGGQGDDAEPLQVLRWFRDNVMLKTPQGQQLVQHYYQVAPMVVDAVDQRPDNMVIYRKIFEQFIGPAVEAIKSGKYPEALQIYSQMVADVSQYASETEDNTMNEMAMDNMGEHAQGVADNPALAQVATDTDNDRHIGDDADNNGYPSPLMMASSPERAITPGGTLSQFNARDSYPTPLRFGRR